MLAVLAFVQCPTLDTVRLVVSASRIAEAVMASADLFEKRSAGLIGGVFPGAFETADFCLFYFYISFVISIIYVGHHTISSVAALT